MFSFIDEFFSNIKVSLFSAYEKSDYWYFLKLLLSVAIGVKLGHVLICYFFSGKDKGYDENKPIIADAIYRTNEAWGQRSRMDTVDSLSISVREKLESEVEAEDRGDSNKDKVEVKEKEEEEEKLTIEEIKEKKIESSNEIFTFLTDYENKFGLSFSDRSIWYLGEIFPFVNGNAFVDSGRNWFDAAEIIDYIRQMDKDNYDLPFILLDLNFLKVLILGKERYIGISLENMENKYKMLIYRFWYSCEFLYKNSISEDKKDKLDLVNTYIKSHLFVLGERLFNITIPHLLKEQLYEEIEFLSGHKFYSLIYVELRSMMLIVYVKILLSMNRDMYIDLSNRYLELFYINSEILYDIWINMLTTSLVLICMSDHSYMSFENDVAMYNYLYDLMKTIGLKKILKGIYVYKEILDAPEKTKKLLEIMNDRFCSDLVKKSISMLSNFSFIFIDKETKDVSLRLSNFEEDLFLREHKVNYISKLKETSKNLYKNKKEIWVFFDILKERRDFEKKITDEGIMSLAIKKNLMFIDKGKTFYKEGELVDRFLDEREKYKKNNVFRVNTKWKCANINTRYDKIHFKSMFKKSLNEQEKLKLDKSDRKISETKAKLLSSNRLAYLK